MKKRILALALMLCMTITGIVGCTGNNGNSENKITAGEETTANKEADNKEELTEEELLFEELFDINNYVQVKIDISDEELQKIQDDYTLYTSQRHSKSPIYRKADKVTFIIGDKSYEIEEVGIRMKGNTSREDFYDKEKGGVYNLIHFRLSFDETFDNPEYYGNEARVWASEAEKLEREDRTFATLSSLEVKWNRNFDQTYVREYYANEMFRAFGVLSQHQNLANMVIAGNNYGVFNIYEPVDKKFIKKNFPKEEETGDLYKAAWTMEPASYTEKVSYGVEDEATGKTYNYDLKTNKKTSDHSLFKNLLSTINDYSVTKETFETVVDGEAWVKYAAVSYFVGNPDDMRNNYNNHYVYLKPDGKSVYIPYDNDRIFGVTVGYNPDGTGMTAVSPFSDMAEGLKFYQYNPLYRLTVIDESGYYYDEYVKMLDEIANSEWLTNEHFEKYYQIAKKNYEDCVTPYKDFENAGKDGFKFSLDGEYTNDPHVNMSMSQYLERKLQTYKDSIS